MTDLLLDWVVIGRRRSTARGEGPTGASYRASPRPRRSRPCVMIRRV